ncbi:MAG: hypothetical protein NTV43_15655 [Methylococcales bacterium]|nr:hypothetical protein [Methylococcales bacterium]
MRGQTLIGQEDAGASTAAFRVERRNDKHQLRIANLPAKVYE